MDIEEHHRRFQEIVEKYGLASSDRADEIAAFLTSGPRQLSSDEFASLFAIEEEDAKVFLSFIQKGIDFRERTSQSK